MLLAHLLEVCSKRVLERHRKDCDPILPPLSITNDDLAALEIDILYAQSRAFEDP